MIAVGTPQSEDGSADLQHVLEVARSIGECIEGFKVIVNKSTVPVGTADRVRSMISTTLQKRNQSVEFAVVSNPEFLKEGDAVEDFQKPDRIVVGVENKRAASIMRELYTPFNRNHDRMIFMDVRSAELTKYAGNAMLATKISLMNEIANLRNDSALTWSPYALVLVPIPGSAINLSIRDVGTEAPVSQRTSMP